jgi:hypothetical protein
MAKTKTKEKATTFIQWKGTVVCMDVHCPCGHHGHIDAGFAYNYQCPKCEQVYECGDSIELTPVDKPNSDCVAVGDYVGDIPHIPYNELIHKMCRENVDMSRICDKRFERPFVQPTLVKCRWICPCKTEVGSTTKKDPYKHNYCPGCGARMFYPKNQEERMEQ